MISLRSLFASPRKDREGSTRFCILFHPRSGSSWLRSSIAQNDRTKIGYEVFADRKVRTGADQRTAIQDFFEEKDRPRTLVGFKLAPYQIPDPDGLLVQADELSIRFVALRRRDVFRTAVSQLRRKALAERERREGRPPVQNRRSDIEPLPPLALPVNKFVQRLKDDVEERNRLDDLAARANDPLRLEYEELLADPVGEMQRLSGYLDFPLSYLGDGPIRKTTPNRLEDSVLNLEQLIDAVRALGLPGPLDSAA
jgi:LPS sulfotransferase NodH